jgi:hypothetical protein
VKVFLVAIAFAALLALAAAYALSSYVQETATAAYSAPSVRLQ